MPNLNIEVDEQIYQHYISANPLQKQHIKKLVEETLWVLLPNITKEKNEKPMSCLELAEAHGLVGCIKGLPSDLSENKAYMDGYGK
jgi:hypothetical protein